jgi:hypothetical protein
LIGYNLGVLAIVFGGKHMAPTDPPAIFALIQNTQTMAMAARGPNSFNAAFPRSSFGGGSSSASDVLADRGAGSTVTGAAPGQSNYQEEKGASAHMHYGDWRMEYVFHINGLQYISGCN